MSFSEVRVINHGFFKESRCFLETFNERNDINQKTGKAGIRCHGWLTALFLRIFGLIETIRTDEGKLIFLNKHSFNKWRKRHQAKIPEVEEGTLPTAQEIIKGRIEAIITLQKLAKAKQGREEFEAKKLHKKIEDLAAEVEQLETEKKNIDSKYNELVSNQRVVLKKSESEINQLEEELSCRNPIKAIFGRKPQNEEGRPKRTLSTNDIKEQIGLHNRLIEDTRNAISKYPQQKEEEIREIDRQIEIKRSELEEKEQQLGKKIVESPLIRSTLVDKLPQRMVEKDSALGELMEEEASPVNKMLSDIEIFAHPKLKQLMELMISKFGEDCIESWEFDHTTKKFKMQLSETRKAWIQPTNATGKIDSLTPKGVVMILGNNRVHLVTGMLYLNKIDFDSGCFTNFCAFQKVIFKGEVDAVIKQIAYHVQKENIIVNSYATPRGKYKKHEGPQEKVQRLDTVLKIWSDAKRVNDADHEKYLRSIKSK